MYRLCLLSFLSGIVLIKIFGWVSNQKMIRRARDVIKANMLEVVLYRRNPALSLRAQFKMMRWGVVYLRYVLTPFIILFIPSLIWLAQFDLRYGVRSFNLGEESILSVDVQEEADLDHFSISITDGLKVLTPPLRIKEKNEINWRIKALKEGTQLVSIQGLGQKYDKQVEVGGAKTKLSEGRYGKWFDCLIKPGEERLSDQSKITAITIKYPRMRYDVFGLQLHWLSVFFIISLMSGLVFKRFLRVEI